MWYKINSINHEKFNDFLNFDNNYGCNRLRTNKHTLFTYNEALKKTNPIEIYYYDDGVFQIYEIVNLHEGVLNILGYSIKWDFSDKRIIPTESYHGIAQWVLDMLNRKEVDKVEIHHVITKDWELNSEADIYLKEVKAHWGAYWIDNGDVDKKIYESYGIKVIEIPSITTYELM